MPQAWSKITITFTNEHESKDHIVSDSFQLVPGVFYKDIPEWVTSHPLWATATQDYNDPHGIEREADIVLFEDPSERSFPSLPTAGLTRVSGTNVSENPQAGKPLKGATLKRVDKAAKPSPTAAVVSALTDGAEPEQAGEATEPSVPAEVPASEV